MTPRHACLIALLGLAIATPAPAQTQPCCPPPAGGARFPLLFVRVAGPAGTRVTFYQGRARPREYPGPAVVGMRPGYNYRVMISDFPDNPGMTLFPTLTVLDTLCLPPNLRPANFPATLTIDEDDIEAIRRGSMITKVIYLEHPDHADPVATKSSNPIQITFPPRTDLMKHARERGRPMVIVHLGGRVPTGEELARQNVPGTILHPDEKNILPAAGPPHLHTPKGQLFDPILGPRMPEEECFHDGGDRGRKAAINNCGGLYGLDPEDTVAVYKDSKGRKSVVCSNRVCLCVPRFPVLRTECPVANAEEVLSLDQRNKIQRLDLLNRREPPVLAARYDHLNLFRGRLRPSENINSKSPLTVVGLKVLQAQQIDLGPFEFVGTKRFAILTPIQKTVLLKQLELAREFSGSKNVAGTDQVIVTSIVGRVEAGPEVVSAEASTRDITVCCHETPCLPEKPLVLVKCADKQAAQIGDIITFSLRYSNVGGRAITDVAVSDSLSGRLEYVEGSAEADRDAVFTMQRNEAGSVVLRWEISGKLLPGESGRLRFKARVR